MPNEERKDLVRRLARMFRRGQAFGGIARGRVPVGNIPFKQPIGTGREFLKGSTMLYVQPPQSPGGSFARLCVAGDTKIVTSHGTTTIKELSDQWAQGTFDHDVKIYTWDHKTNTYLFAPCIKPAPNKEDEIWEVSLSDGTVIRCNDKHPFLTENKLYIEAQCITEGMTLSCGLVVLGSRNTKEKELVYDITIPEYENFGILCDDGCIVITHNTSYAEFSEMDADALLASALDIYADEVTSEDENGDIIKIYSANDDIQEELESLFFNTLTIETFLWMWAREMCKYGDNFLMLDLHENHGLVGALPIPANEIEREEGFDKDDPTRVRFRWLTHQKRDLELFEIIHFRLLSSTWTLPYGRSILDQARRIWRSLVMMEDAMLVYRLVRAPERRIFFVDVGNTDPEKVEPYMNHIVEQVKANKLTSEGTGVHDMKYNALSVLDDMFIPVRGSESGTRIDQLPAGTYNNDIEDVEYFRKKLVAALKIPAPFLGYEELLGCLDINTKIRVLDSRGSITIAQIIEDLKNKKDLWTYSCTPDGNILPGKITNAWKTGTRGDIYKIIIDNGKSVICTSNHLFMMRNGKYKSAENLTIGDSLMPLYTRTNQERLSGYEQVQINKQSNNGKYPWVFTHRIVSEYFNGPQGSNIIHHKNCCALDNQPDNLEMVSRKNHIAIHDDIARENLCSDASRAKLRETMKTSQYIKNHKNGVLRGWKENKKRKEILAKNNQRYNKAKKMLEAYASQKDNIRETWNTTYKRKASLNAITQFKNIGFPPTIQNITDAAIYVYENHDSKNFSKKNILSVLGYRENSRIIKRVLDKNQTNFKKIKSLIFSLNNHKVVEIEKINTSIDVYDLEVKKYHNFATEAGVFLHNSKSTLSMEDIRFSKTIRRIQNTILPELYKMAVIHLYSKGVSGDSLLNFDIKLATPSNIAELQNLELWRTRLEIAGAAQEGIFSKDFIYKVLFKLSDEQIQDMYRYMLREKMVQSKIEQTEYKSPEEDAEAMREKDEAAKEEQPTSPERAEEGTQPFLTGTRPTDTGARPFGNKQRTQVLDLVKNVSVTPDDGVGDPYDRKANKVRRRTQDRIMDGISGVDDIQTMLNETKAMASEERKEGLIDQAARKVDNIDKLIESMKKSN